jgi:hypothetical protein
MTEQGRWADVKRWTGVADIAWCPEHGLHGARDTCFECGKPVRQIPMVPIAGEERLNRLVADFEAGGDAERDNDEPGVASSVYYDCAAKLRAALNSEADCDDLADDLAGAVRERRDARDQALETLRAHTPEADQGEGPPMKS